MPAAAQTRWHVVQSVRTGLYHVVRHRAGCLEQDMEFLRSPRGYPRTFATGNVADRAAYLANYKAA